MAGSIIEATDGTFEVDILKSEAVVLVDFWAPWCGPCRVVAPIIEELFSEHGEKMKFAKVNVDENPETASKYHVMSIPTFLVLEGGEEKKRFSGAMPKERFLQELSEWLK